MGKQNKILKFVILFLVFLLVLVIGIGVGIFVSDNKKENKNNNNVENTNRTGNTIETKVENEEQTKENQKNDESNITSNQNSESKSNYENSDNLKYAEEYIKIIDKVKSENPNGDLTADLIYFNNDSIPDLVIDMPGYWVSLYIYENGKVYNPVEQWPYGVGGSKYYNYQEKNGNIYNYGNEFAGAIMIESNYILNSKQQFDELSFIGEGVEIEETDSNYQLIQKELEENGGYFYNGEKISEQEYSNKLKAFSISTDQNKYKSLDGKTAIDTIKKQLQQ